MMTSGDPAPMLLEFLADVRDALLLLAEDPAEVSVTLRQLAAEIEEVIDEVIRSGRSDRFTSREP